MYDPLEGSHTAPKFAAPDPGEAARWYEKHLGFRTAVFDDGNYAIVRRGKLALHLWKRRPIATSCQDASKLNPRISPAMACENFISGTLPETLSGSAQVSKRKASQYAHLGRRIPDPPDT